MRRISILKGAAVALATFGIAIPQTRILAEERNPHPKPEVKIAAPNTVFDVQLASNGEFTGRVIEQDGSPVACATVVIKQDKIKIGSCETDSNGNFLVADLKPGTFQVHSGATIGFYRMWSEKTAPPSAKPHGLLVLGKDGARGQYGLTETIAGENLGLILLASMTGLAIAGVILAIQAKDVADEAKKIASKAFHSP